MRLCDLAIHITLYVTDGYVVATYFCFIVLDFKKYLFFLHVERVQLQNL